MPMERDISPRGGVLENFWLAVTYLQFLIEVCFFGHDWSSQQMLLFNQSFHCSYSGWLGNRNGISASSL